MIPITVSYFTKRNAKTRARSIFEAGLYSVGIIATFTFLGFLLTFLFGAGGINRLAASPLVNIAIAAIFIVFALSLFGVLELALPNSWLNAVNRESGRHKGVLGILLMALTFSLTSFTCTVPFVGTVMVAALQGDWIWSLMGMTAFAAVFSLPFFLLALFPSLLQSLPKSGNWMNSVKITMGFLELAAALKFISNVDLVYQWEILTRPIFITFWLAIGLVLVVYLLGWFRFPHETPSEAIGAFRVMSAIFFLAVTFYLFRGLFGFSLGELDAFLPPRDYGAVEASLAGAPFLAAAGHTIEEDRWYDDYGEALSVARREGKPVFIDFTGYTCTNCRWMEANMFPLPRVSELMNQFVRVRLYTDGGEPVHEANQRFEQERFKTIALPFYALMTPDDEVIATFPGLTRNSNEFVEFLQKGTRYLQAGEDLSLSLPGR
jgi:thiol:disulfide interchange protein